MNPRFNYLQLGVVFLATLLAIGCCKNHNRESVWNGTWKLNLSKSLAYGSYFTIGINPDGMVTVTNAAYSYSFRCNNKEFQDGVGHTVVCSPISASEWKLAYRANGKDTGTFVWGSSPDGKTLTIYSSDGLSETTFSRRDGVHGFAGRWQETEPLRLRPKILEVALDGRRLHLAYPEIGQYSDSPLDGTTVPLHGPRVPEGTTVSVIEISPQELQTQLIYSGRMMRKGTLAISEEGRILYQESWIPTNPNDKDRLVYDKQ